MRLEREYDARVAVAEERRRIARDLHDVIAHSVSVMTVQAGAARLLLATQPERARIPLLSVEDTGRQALTELRRLLGILRTEEGEAARRNPASPTSSGCLNRCAAPGCLSSCRWRRRRPLAPGVELAGYRIVQEALTNAIKHAGPARAHVAIRYTPDGVELEIMNDGLTGANGGEGGHGLVGMRERAALYGGELEAAAATAAVSSSARGYRLRLERDPRPDRRRPGARAGRLSDDPRGAEGHRGRR